MTDQVAVLGIRHHGPGSARSVAAELDRIKPAIVLIEGPADADPLLGLAAEPGMVPPVALLAYAPEEPRTSAFWPFAVFSPEWQALIWAAEHDVPARFCDLPAGAVLVREEGEHTFRSEHDDPIGTLAGAANCDDPERWWDDVIESRLDGGRRSRRSPRRWPSCGPAGRMSRPASSGARRTCGGRSVPR